MLGDLLWRSVKFISVGRQKATDGNNAYRRSSPSLSHCSSVLLIAVLRLRGKTFGLLGFAEWYNAITISIFSFLLQGWRNDRDRKGF